MNKPRVPDAWFVELWQSAPSLPAAAELTGYAVYTARRRAARLRAAGAVLRRLPGRHEPEPLWEYLEGGDERPNVHR